MYVFQHENNLKKMSVTFLIAYFRHMSACNSVSVDVRALPQALRLFLF